MKTRAALLLLLVSALFLSACGPVGATRIGRILNDPARYQNRSVTVRGTVVNSASAVVAGVYRVDDGTGTIAVLSNGNAPRRGAQVTLRGRVQGGISILGQSFGTTIREQSHRVRY